MVNNNEINYVEFPDKLSNDIIIKIVSLIDDDILFLKNKKILQQIS